MRLHQQYLNAMGLLTNRQPIGHRYISPAEHHYSEAEQGIGELGLDDPERLVETLACVTRG